MKLDLALKLQGYHSARVLKKRKLTHYNVTNKI